MFEFFYHGKFCFSFDGDSCWREVSGVVTAKDAKEAHQKVIMDLKGENRYDPVIITLNKI